MNITLLRCIRRPDRRIQQLRRDLQNQVPVEMSVPIRGHNIPIMVDAFTAYCHNTGQLSLYQRAFYSLTTETLNITRVFNAAQKRSVS